MIKPLHIATLFTQMQVLYGAKWSAGPAVNDQGNGLSATAEHWLLLLSEYSPDQIAVGVLAVKQQRPEWPPGALEFMDLMDGVPTVEQLLDRDTDYGPVCRAIREKIDWFNVESMSSRHAREAVQSKRESVIGRLRQHGAMAALATQHVQHALGSSPKNDVAFALPRKLSA